MGAVLTLAVKDLRVLSRDKFALFWIFAFPLMYAGFFGVLFGDDDDGGARGKLALTIVDEDQSADSARLVARLAGHESLLVPAAGEGAAAGPALSSLAEAQAAVRKGQQVAYVRIPQGYGDSPFALFAPQEEGAARLELGLDPRRKAEAGFLQGVLMEAIFGGMGELFADKEVMREQLARGQAEIAQADDIAPAQKLVLQTFMSALQGFFDAVDPEVLQAGPTGSLGGDGLGELIDVVEVAREQGNRPRSTFEITLPSALIWGLMSVAMAFAITIVRERTQGTLLRLRIAPIGGAALLAGKALGCFLTCMIVMALVLGVGVLALDVRVSSAPLLLLSTACTAACFTGLMMSCAVIGKTEEAVAGMTWGIMMPFAMIGGGMIPLIAMPPWLVTASHASPFKWGILAVEGAIWRGFSIGDMALPCLILLAIGVVFFTLGAVVFRRAETRA